MKIIIENSDLDLSDFVEIYKSRVASGKKIPSLVLEGFAEELCLAGLNLDGAEMTNSELALCDFRGTSLRFASLYSSDLRGVKFDENTDLHGASLEDSRLDDDFLIHAFKCEASLSDGHRERAKALVAKRVEAEILSVSQASSQGESRRL